MKKATGWILFGITAGATAAGVYYFLQNKEKFVKTEEIVNPDGTTQTKRTYVPLDMDNAKAKVTETFNKTKEAAQETWKKVETKFEEVKSSMEGSSKEEAVESVDVNYTELNNDEPVVAAAKDAFADTPQPDSSEEISDFSAEEE